jgi:hypothetical protein
VSTQLGPEIDGLLIVIELSTDHRSTAAIATALVHVLVVMMLLSIEKRPLHSMLESPQSPDRPAYFVVEDVMAPAIRETEATPESTHTRSIRSKAENPHLPGTAVDFVTIRAGHEKDHEPVDWQSEAHMAAGNVVDAIVRNESRKCLDVPEPGSWLPPCKPPVIKSLKSRGKERISVPIGLAYVGLIVQAGKLASDGHLFDEMRNPDLDRSSVPDSSDMHQLSNAVLKHRSVVFNKSMGLPGASR